MKVGILDFPVAFAVAFQKKFFTLLPGICLAFTEFLFVLNKCSPEVLFETCVTMKFVDDDDDVLENLLQYR